MAEASRLDTEPVAFSDLIQRAQSRRNRILAIDERGEELTFAGFAREVADVAAALSGLGVGMGSRVAWQLPTWLESLVLIGALSRLGATQIPVLPTHRHREVGFILTEARPELFIVPDVWQGFNYRAMATAVAESMTGPEILCCDRLLPRSGSARFDVGGARPAVDAHPTRWMFYTSGTTAQPKGARHSDATVLAAAAALIDRMAVDERDRMSLVFPVSHIGGVIWLAVAILTGCTLLVVERFRPDETSAFLARHGVTLAGAGTAFHLGYLEVQARTPNCSIFPNVRGFPSGAGPKPPNLHGRLKREIGGVGILSGYGLTECPNITVTPPDASDEQLATTEGRPTRGVDLKVVGADGTRQPTGREGEIRVRGPQLFAGYVDATLDADAFDEERYFRTGDLGTLDDMGYLKISGRIKDVIIRKGENISAKEIEDLLFDHPAVADVSVVGVPDWETGERCVAVLVAAADREPLTVADVGAYLESRGLARRKFPEQVWWLDTMPRDPSGKVRKAAIRKCIVAAGESASPRASGGPPITARDT